MTQRPNRFPETRGRHGGSSGAQRACQQPREPFLQITGKGRSCGESAGPAEVTAALSGAGGKGRAGDLRLLRPGGWGAAAPKTAGSRSRHDPSSPGSRRGGPAPPPRAPPFPPACPGGPPPWGTDTHQSRRRRHSFSRRAPWPPQQPRRRDASETQTRVCSKSRAQRHSTAASHNTLGLPSRALSAPPSAPARPASPAGFLPAPSAAPGPAPWQPCSASSRKAPRVPPAPRDAEWALIKPFAWNVPSG